LYSTSGYSASLVSSLFYKLAKGETLSPITSNPDEWSNAAMDGEKPLWQNKRNYSCFSYDGGKTWYNHNDCVFVYETPKGSRWQTSCNGSKLPDLAEGEFIVKEPQCDKCMIKETCEKAWIPQGKELSKSLKESK
jgi:hypothetical protein